MSRPAVVDSPVPVDRPVPVGCPAPVSRPAPVSGPAPVSRPVLVLNGPNLGRLGIREPAVYGPAAYADLVALCEHTGTELGLAVEVRQTDHEGELLGWLHAAADAGSRHRWWRCTSGIGDHL